jgi:tetratricopeptide (TPR) repeat protein
MPRPAPIRPPWLLLLALVAACGGAESAVRAQGTPLAATLAQASAPGTAELRAGQLAGARAGFESSLRSDPDRMDALNDLAVTYHLEGRFEAARQLLDEVVARGTPRDQQLALVNLAELYALDGYLDAAQAHLDGAREIDPQRPEPAYARALLADGEGDAEASRWLQEALRLDAEGTARRSLAFVYPEERAHLEALLAEAAGDRATAQARWRELRTGRFPALAAAAARHLGEP